MRDEIARIERLFDARQEEVVHPIDRVGMKLHVEPAFDVDLQLEPRGRVKAREVENLNVPAGAHLERHARELIRDGARQFLEEELALDGTVEGQPEFDRLLLAAERLPERLAAQTRVKILPRDLDRRLRAVVAFDRRERLFERLRGRDGLELGEHRRDAIAQRQIRRPGPFGGQNRTRARRDLGPPRDALADEPQNDGLAKARRRVCKPKLLLQRNTNQITFNSFNTHEFKTPSRDRNAPADDICATGRRFSTFVLGAWRRRVGRLNDVLSGAAPRSMI